jgi:hypothetical protein
MRSAVTVAVAAGIAALGLFTLVPMTWDESWNFLHVSSQGVRAAFTSYEQPNNHVLFTALQAALPADWVRRAPGLLRLPNVLIACAMAALLVRYLHSSRLAILVLFCSPLFTLYLCVARGYLLGTLFLLGAVAAAERPVLAGILAGLSAGCVPTFGFALPGAALALPRGRFRAAVAAGLVVIATDGFILGKMAHQRQLWGLEWHYFLRSTFLPAWPAHLCLGLALLLLIKERPRGRALGLLGACASTFVVITVLTMFNVADPPYPRNLLFVPLFLWLAVLQASRARPAAVVLLCLAAAFEVRWLVQSVRPGGDPNLHPYLRELTPTPLSRAEDFDALSCAFQATPVCELYARGRPVHELTVVPPTCAAGSIRPPPTETVVLEPHARLLCY